MESQSVFQAEMFSTSGVIIPFFAGIGIGIVVTNHLLDLNSGIGSSSGTVTSL